MTPASPSPPFSLNPPRSTPRPAPSPNPHRSTPRPPPSHKQALSTPVPTPGRRDEPASLCLPALRPSTNTPPRPPVQRSTSFSSLMPEKQEEVLAGKIDNTLSKLFEKVDDALLSNAAPEKIGKVPVVRLDADPPSSNPAIDRRAEIATIIEKIGTAFPDPVASKPATLTDIAEEAEEEVEKDEAVVRTKTPVEEATEIRRGSGWKCCPSSSPKKHTDGCMAVTRWPKENAAPTKTSAARTSLIIAYNMEDISNKKRVDKLLSEDWVCKAHKSSPPAEDTELYVCMRCTRNRTNKAGGGRRP